MAASQPAVEFDESSDWYKDAAVMAIRPAPVHRGTSRQNSKGKKGRATGLATTGKALPFDPRQSIQ